MLPLDLSVFCPQQRGRIKRPISACPRVAKVMDLTADDGEGAEDGMKSPKSWISRGAHW